MTNAFPFATHLVFCHMAFGSMCSFVLYACAPSLYPSLTHPEKKVAMSVSMLFVRASPIALFFAGSLVLSNVAYIFASVPFLQMMKQGNVVIVYVLSLMLGLETWRTRSVLLLTFILLCTSTTVLGELRFSVVGFGVQGCSQLLESARLLLQSIFLSGSMKLDVLSYNLVVMPLCGAALLALMVAHHLVLASDVHMVGGQSEAASLLSAWRAPSMSDFTAHWHLLLPNFMLAFLLNVLIAVFIKVSSAFSMVLTSLLKDIFIVVLAEVMHGGQVSKQQALGFTLQMLGIFAWSLMKAFPKHFEEGVIQGMANVLKAIAAAPSEPQKQRFYTRVPVGKPLCNP
eukprot:CAMPEP_0178391018 /NCGR_PEP_ID=MMETSP0689_2-20121128/10946_1 /TAXON_ID=160604 /ORGANISM="Amphidinium massartii, Strain CS-259" /LENGTH=341 /DNA_ID=CAMNT_0020011547 /DNA_START=143 /DNA_END=1165 /DNA_ORIENTATION=-